MAPQVLRSPGPRPSVRLNDRTHSSRCSALVPRMLCRLLQRDANLDMTLSYGCSCACVQNMQLYSWFESLGREISEALLWSGDAAFQGFKRLSGMPSDN